MSVTIPKSSNFELTGGSRWTGASHEVSENCEKNISFPPRPGCPSDEKKRSPEAFMNGYDSFPVVFITGPRFTGSPQ